MRKEIKGLVVLGYYSMVMSSDAVRTEVLCFRCLAGAQLKVHYVTDSSSVVWCEAHTL